MQANLALATLETCLHWLALACVASRNRSRQTREASQVDAFGPQFESEFRRPIERPTLPRFARFAPFCPDFGPFRPTLARFAARLVGLEPEVGRTSGRGLESQRAKRRAHDCRNELPTEAGFDARCAQ